MKIIDISTSDTFAVLCEYQEEKRWKRAVKSRNYGEYANYIKWQ